MQWLRDGLGVIADAAETGALAEALDREQNVKLVPAFVGLVRPVGTLIAAVLLVPQRWREWHWKRGLPDVGLAGGDAFGLGQWHGQQRLGGRFLRIILRALVDRPQITETTALGAAWLVGHRAGIYPDRGGFAKGWALERTFTSGMDCATRNARYAAWGRGVQAMLSV